MAHYNLDAVLPEIKENYGKFYVYLMFRLDGSPFYVGAGKSAEGRETRFSAHIREALWGWDSPKHLVIREMLGLGHKIVCAIDSWHIDRNKAFAREDALISQIGRIDLGVGPLINESAGGNEGKRNFSSRIKAKKAEASKRAQSLAKIAEADPTFRHRVAMAGTQAAAKWMAENRDFVIKNMRSAGEMAKEWCNNNPGERRRICALGGTAAAEWAKKNPEKSAEIRMRAAVASGDAHRKKAETRKRCLEMIARFDIFLSTPSAKDGWRKWQDFEEELLRIVAR